MNPTPPIQSIHLAVAVSAISKTKQMGGYTEQDYQVQANHADFDYTVLWFEYYIWMK